MPFPKQVISENLEKYGPKMGSNVSKIEETVSLAAGRKPRSSKEMMGQNLMAMAGRSDASKENEKLIKEAEELGSQYKREARGTEGSSSTIPKKMLSALGFKHGGKISTCSPNKSQSRW
jgi:hypothetical protein